MTKIAIVGTSNSARRNGWVSMFIKNHPELEVDNFSIGVVTSLYGNYIIDKNNICDNYDFCIIDFCINDQTAIDFKSLTPDLLEKSFLSLLGKFAKKGCRCIPIVLILGRRNYVFTIDDHYIRNSVLKICAEHDVYCCDIPKIIFELTRGQNKEPTEIFFEFNHYSDVYCMDIEKNIYNMIMTAKHKELVIPRSIDFVCVEDKKIELLNCEKKELGTSLAKHETILLEKNSSITLKDVENLYGIFCFTHPMSGNVYIDSGETVVKKNLADQFKNLFFLKHLSTPLFSKSNTFKITATSDHEDSFDDLWLSKAPFTHDQSESIAGICGFLTANKL